MYAGLTTADKGALIKLKESGVKITTIISLRRSANTSLKSNYDNIDIDLALAQVAEMETAQTPTIAPLTWNERINQMSAEEKADLFLGEMVQVHNEILRKAWESTDKMETLSESMTKWLNSPYTEGETT